MWHVSTLNTNANAVIYNITPFVCGDTGDKNIPMKCGRHRNEIHRIMNMDGANIFEGDDDICLICMDSLDTKSIWGRFVCSTCPLWYHNDCLINYVNNKGLYHRDSCTARYDMTRLRCAVCRQSPRSIETL